ncbi:MAG: hypothetical protein PHT91_02825, partial [Candidatus Nanoarchaeia archaeon]|nr:hypothetical protein [Candidatus Nanoarchaeia archaeon]
ILIIPLTITALILSILEGLESWNSYFLIGVLVFLGLELLFDWVLKKDFRKNWKLLTLYLPLYFFANYALIMIVWELNTTLGIILLILYIIQLIFNTFSHQSVRKKFGIK